MRHLFDEVFLSRDYAFPSSVSDPVIIDGGAHIGFSVMFFKQMYPAARIVAFEPNPEAFRLLQHNVSANRLECVVLRAAALSDKEGEIPFFLASDAASLVASTRAERGGSQRLTVKSERLSRTLESLDRVDLVKLDAEGGEFAILHDLIATGTLAKPRRYIIEYHHQIGGETPRFSEFLAPFERAGFKYQVAARIAPEPDSFQDVLVHFVRA
jgi:FkbM family methyltransferase